MYRHKKITMGFFISKIIIQFYIITMLLTATAIAEPSAQQVLEYIEKQKLNGGLIVQLGLKDADELTTYAKRNLVVQCLEMDPQKVDQARKRIIARKKYGGVSLQRLYSAEKLPYSDNLIRILIVKNGYKLSKEEMLRVAQQPGEILEKLGEQVPDHMKKRERPPVPQPNQRQRPMPPPQRGPS